SAIPTSAVLRGMRPLHLLAKHDVVPLHTGRGRDEPDPRALRLMRIGRRPAAPLQGYGGRAQTSRASTGVLWSTPGATTTE
ncbi:MAG TPA: hypothetical protein VGN34_07470, partial [Ktedonobacteraceae bacterium]